MKSGAKVSAINRMHILALLNTQNKIVKMKRN